MGIGADHRARNRIQALLLAVFVCTITLMMVPAVAHADTIYVDISREHDITGNGSYARPYQHITKGLAESSYGDTSPLLASEDKLGTVIKGDDTGRLLSILAGDSNTVVDGIAFWDNDITISGGAHPYPRRCAPHTRLLLLQSAGPYRRSHPCRQRHIFLLQAGDRALPFLLVLCESRPQRGWRYLRDVRGGVDREAFGGTAVVHDSVLSEADGLIP